MTRITVLTVSVTTVLITSLFAADAPAATQPVVPAIPRMEVSAKPHQCELPRCLTLNVLQQRKLAKFHQVMDDIKAQRALIADFERYAAWMNSNLAAYNRYIQAGSAAAAITRFLPIPYAGQAAVFSKFVAQFSQTLGAASKSLDTYLQISQQVLTLAARLDPATPDPKSLADVHTLADVDLLKATSEANQQLKNVADLSSGAQAFLVGLSNYLATGDEYLHKVKGVFKKEAAQQEKSFLTESIGNLKTQTELFNSRLKNFEILGGRISTAVKSLSVYDELAAETATASADK